MCVSKLEVTLPTYEQINIPFLQSYNKQVYWFKIYACIWLRYHFTKNILFLGCDGFYVGKFKQNNMWLYHISNVHCPEKNMFVLTSIIKADSRYFIL